MPVESTTGAPDWRDAAKLRKFLADDIPQWTPSEGAENTRAFLAALREKCSTEIGAMTGLLLALFEERVDASKAGYELAQKLKRGGGGATPREELDMEMLFGDTKDFVSATTRPQRVGPGMASACEGTSPGEFPETRPPGRWNQSVEIIGWVRGGHPVLQPSHPWRRQEPHAFERQDLGAQQYR